MAQFQEKCSRIKWFLKQNKYFFVHTCIHSTVGLGMHMTIWNRLYFWGASILVRFILKIAGVTLLISIDLQ